jgi:hypothetical protein
MKQVFLNVLCVASIGFVAVACGGISPTDQDTNGATAESIKTPADLMESSKTPTGLTPAADPPRVPLDVKCAEPPICDTDGLCCDCHGCTCGPCS